MCVPAQRGAARRRGSVRLDCHLEGARADLERRNPGGRVLGAARMACLLFASACLPAHAGTVSVTAHVENVRAGNERVTLTTSEAHINPAGCQYTGYYEMLNDASKNPKLAILLAAQASDRTVVLEVSDNQCGPFGMPVVVFLTIRK